ncbi:unnamed protein product [Effrenium voratum]|uniref:EF-hand domain-containing protein n=1 Tax=Effrenium voratum TaxID=2562239 RepID=A0AA36HLB9_9DINO|nr:unnamed protein product [Effrenium voratum]
MQEHAAFIQASKSNASNERNVIRLGAVGETLPGAHQWVKKGQREAGDEWCAFCALRWYRMPLPEFLWRVHGAWQRQSGREEAPLDVFTQSLRQRYRSLASGRLLLRTAGALGRKAAHSLDSAANLLARLRRHLERPRARAGAWRPVSFAAADAAPLRRLLRQGRPRARLELRRALGALRLPPVGALPVKGKAAMVLAGALAVSGGSSLWLAACRKEAPFGFVWLVSARCYFQITAAARRVRPPARMASGVEGVEIQELVLPEVSVYKVLGCESTLAEYNDHSSRFGNPRSDWKAMYTQLMASHALGTVPYRWDQMDSQGSPYRCANLVQVCFLEPLPVVRCSGPFFWDGSVPGEEKAAVLRSALGLSKEPLMAQLGLAQKAVLMEETEGEWELILDHRHLAALPHESCLVATFQRGALPVTATFASRDGERQKYAARLLGHSSPVHVSATALFCVRRSAAKERASLSPTPKKVAVPAGCCRLILNSCYDVQKLRPCLEALGLRIHDEEWPEAIALVRAWLKLIPFGAVGQMWIMAVRSGRIFHFGLCGLDRLYQRIDVYRALAKRPQTPQRGDPTAEPAAPHMGSLSNGELKPKVSDFELFEQCFFQAHITRQRRRMERELCEECLGSCFNDQINFSADTVSKLDYLEHNLTEEQIDEFRAKLSSGMVKCCSSDVVPLDFLFRKFGILGKVLELLVASGADAQLLRSDLVPIFMREARHLANLARQKRMPKPEPPQPSMTVDSVGWKKLQSKARPRVRRSFRQFEIISAGGEDINFFEFLYLIRFVREKSREVQLEKLQSFFLRLDQDECGNVTIKEAMKLFPELGLSPRSRLEQLEIKQVLNEVDEDGTGSFSWMDFTEVVQLCQERLERLARADEERFALNLNFTLERCHELRKVFLDSKNESNVLEVTDLRRAMTILQRWYTSEELLPLFAAFARDGHMDFRCFARMMHAIEILKTEGQLAQDKKPPRKSLMESMTEPLFS